MPVVSPFVVRGRKVPSTPPRSIVRPTTNEARSCVNVRKFVGPLPHQADHILHSKRRRAIGKHSDRGGQWANMTCHLSVRPRWVPTPPWIGAFVHPLCSVLPFPIVRQSFLKPSAIGRGITHIDPGDRRVLFARRECSTCAIPRSRIRKKKTNYTLKATTKKNVRTRNKPGIQSRRKFVFSIGV